MAPGAAPQDDDKTAFIGPLEAGLVIDDLELVRKLGEGSQGVVFEAQQRTFGRRVAVKLLPSTSAPSVSQIERFKREAEAAGRLNHPNIVGTHAFREWRGQYLIVQELVTGGDLEDAIERRHKPGASRRDELERWAVGICKPLAQALHFAHQNGVIHRDIKPSNVLLTDDGLPKITDFGLAKVEDDRGISRTGVAVGTPYYMSPEQVRAERGGIDHRTDLYSLGAVLYRMLSGRVPFSGKTRQGLLLDILTRDPPSLRKLAPGVDRDLEAVCLKCLEKEPGERYASGQGLAEDLHRWEEGLGTSARPASMVSLPFRRMRRQATSGLVLLTALVPVAFLALDFGWLRPRAVDLPATHLLRQGSLALAALLFMWPLSVLARRLAGGRSWARWPAIGACLLLCAAGVWSIGQERLDQLQTASRNAVFAAAEVDDKDLLKDALDTHAADWSARFDGRDETAMAYGSLLLGRLRDTESWIARTQDDVLDDPVPYALQAAVNHALGVSDPDGQTERRLTQRIAELGRSDRMILVGDIFQAAGRFDLAENAYLVARDTPDVDRQALDFSLAKLHYRTCRLPEAQADIAAVLRYRPREPVINVWAARIARKAGDRAAVEAHLKAAASAPRWHFPEFHDDLVSQGRLQEARDLALQTAETHGDDPFMVAVAASRLRDAGHQADARRLYEHLALLEDWEAIAAVNRAAVEIDAAQQALAMGDRTEARACLERSSALLDEALARDPESDAGLFNRAQVALYSSVAEHGFAFDAWPAAAWQAPLDAFHASLAVNAIRDEALNNAAYALGRLYRLDPAAPVIDEALELARRAVLRASPAPGSDCPPDGLQRARLSRALDTLASLHEWRGDLPAAVAMATRAVQALAPGDGDLAKRKDSLARLTARAGAQ